ncbi:hypothetical protein [Fulvivirga ligni]|uniref:hypothetical protein n=1 Tax=Fulvivirga ligni TaxID=2904246 RepID=UPI001F370BE1|nr:hypothetical protein [Fulvivirga ligni]UII24231.1 hypothetical protein LVD16_13500 [Fulvivirga ligni]
MKRLIILVLFALPLLSYCQDNSMDLYRLAIVEIKTTDQFKSFTDNKDVNFQVMPEVIPLNQMGFIFREELQKQTGMTSV